MVGPRSCLIFSLAPRPCIMEALSHLRVIDLTRVRAGPTCVKQFADWGADVIKIEMPAESGEDILGPRQGSDFHNLHRNKRSLTLNLKDPRGVDVLKRLAKTADVLVENYRPDVTHKLGIDYATLEKENPKLIYASISGFGQDGPYRDRAGFDQVAQGMGGLMWVTGLPGQGPVRAGIPVADLSAGLFAALGIMIALQERTRSGKGQWVQSSLLSSMIAMMDFQAARWLVEGDVPGQAGKPSDVDADQCVSDVGWIREPRSSGQSDIRAHGRGVWRPGPRKTPGLCQCEPAFEESRCAQRGHRRAHTALSLRGIDRLARESRCAVRADL